MSQCQREYMIKLKDTLKNCVCAVTILTHACTPPFARVLVCVCVCVSHFFWISANCAFHFCSSDSFKGKTDTESWSAESDGEERGTGGRESEEEKKKQR